MKPIHGLFYPHRQENRHVNVILWSGTPINTVLLWNPPKLASRESVFTCPWRMSSCCKTCTVLHILDLDNVRPCPIQPRVPTMWLPCIRSLRKMLKDLRFVLVGEGKATIVQWFHQRPRQFLVLVPQCPWLLFNSSIPSPITAYEWDAIAHVS